MRFLLVVAIWFVIVGGMYSYISHRDAKRLLVQAPVVENTLVADHFTVELTPTFSIEKDPFALTTSTEELPPLEVKLNGIPLSYDSTELQRGVTIRFEEVTGVLAGQNEIYVNASPPVTEDSLEHGVRVKLLRDQNIMVDETVWATKGAIVSGSVSFLHQLVKEEAHDH